MDWFETLTGFREQDWGATRARLSVEGDRLVSSVNGASYGIGTFEMASLGELRARMREATGAGGRPVVSVVQGDVRAMHRDPANAGALFQVASQFNMLEMTGPSVTPEQGVTIYQHDRTQGPACAIAAGAATIWRNYFAPVNGETGQTATRQLDGLADLGAALAAGMKVPPQTLWAMRNGYALPEAATLDRIAAYLAALDAAELDRLRGRLRIGLHRDVEATEAVPRPGPLVSQAFCSAVPVAYSGIASNRWMPLARLVLEAAYEATLWEGVLNARRGASNVVYLTFVGGGAFGNEEAWIHDAIRRAVKIVAGHDLDVRLVSYGTPTSTVKRLAAELA
ncbi:MAG: hypothetical protein LCH95_18180 [Proteobacteria bacterium]|nr:hypothetical protein [Pseudomonadota bacterium]